MKYFKYLFVLLLGLFTVNVNAENVKTYVDLETLEYSLDGDVYTSIKEYESLEDFLEDYNSNSLPNIYITNFLFDGVTAVKTPDLDDFIDSDSNDAKIKTLELKVINIIGVGDYDLSGSIKGAMIAINTNNLKGEINLILNNASIDTDSKKAPAIYVYNKDITYTDCKITIKTIANTQNYLEGGKLKKVSLIPSDDLSSYSKYYSSDDLTNYNKYTNYYGIYTKSEINKILFATVTADSEDLADGDPYYFYKASGAVSSDIDLYFEGEGYLKITSKNKEGVESKGNISLIGGTGDYEIIAYDDCLNTTTASKGNVHNDLTIDVKSLIAMVAEDADEGDAIDSNGKLYINGGKIYAFAHPLSPDSGLDSSGGTYINGGTVIATGNMADSVSNDSKQKYIYATVSGNITSGDTVLFKDQDDNFITAFKTTRSYSNILYSSSDLNYTSYSAYLISNVSGAEDNGLYSKLYSYDVDSEIKVSLNANMFEKNSNQNKTKSSINDFILKELIVESSLLVIFVISISIYSKVGKKRS